ncbi:MAG: SphA family protein [Bosea sp. (in: a-proteobacteria)]
MTNIRSRLRDLAVLAAMSGCLAPAAPANAAESAAGAYVLGIRGPGAGITPPTGLFFSNQFWHYSGKITGNIPFEGGTLAGRANVKVAVNIASFVFVTPLELAGGRFGLTATVPYGHINVKGGIGPLGLRDNITTLADPSVGAFMGWRSGNFHWQLGATTFLPIGDYRRGELANVSKNRLAVDVYGALTWLEPSLGIDVSNTVGVTMNRENEVTKYRTGTELHWEWSISKKFDNGFSIGPAGYVYEQLSGDTGAGARLGSFKGSVRAVGAGIGYEFKAGSIPITARLRYFREFDTRHRLKGDSVFLGVSLPLWVPGAR